MRCARAPAVGALVLPGETLRRAEDRSAARRPWPAPTRGRPLLPADRRRARRSLRAAPAENTHAQGRPARRRGSAGSAADRGGATRTAVPLDQRNGSRRRQARQAGSAPPNPQWPRRSAPRGSRRLRNRGGRGRSVAIGAGSVPSGSCARRDPGQPEMLRSGYAPPSPRRCRGGCRTEMRGTWLAPGSPYRSRTRVRRDVQQHFTPDRPSLPEDSSPRTKGRRYGALPLSYAWA